MIDRKLINNIFQYLKEGYTKQSIYNVYIRWGYNPRDVIDTINYVEPIYNRLQRQTVKPTETAFPQQEKRFKINKIIILFLCVIALIGLASASVLFITKPVCGDGKIGRGETAETCCRDAGCLENQACIDNSCIAYECSLSADCAQDSFCQNNFCKKLTCNNCQYVANHTCTNYECCSDQQCGDNNPLTTDKCMNASTINSYCLHESLNECNTNEDCNDSNASTQDVCTGIPKKCSNTQIVQCVNNDGYCPSGCTYSLDLDCTAPQCSTVADCDDNNASTKDICGGAPRRCLYAPIKECENGDDYCPPGCFYQNDQDCVNVSQINLAVFFFKNIETCFVGDVCADNCFELKKTSGETAKRFEFNNNLKSLKPSDPSLGNYNENQRQCLNLTLSTGKISDAKNILDDFKSDISSISVDKMEIDLDYNEINTIELNFTKLDNSFWLAADDIKGAINANVDKNTDGVMAISEVYDSNLDIYFPTKYCNKTITNAIKGASYSWIPKTTGYSSECLTSDKILHSWLYQVDFALSGIMNIDEEYDDAGEYTSCGQGVDAIEYFPSPADCLTDPDSSFCGQDSCNMGQWNAHLLSEHYNFNLNYIGNHCRNSRKDLDETGVDSGGSCS